MLDFPLAQKVKLHSEKGLSREIYLSKQEVTDLVSAVDDEEARKVILIAANTGLRRSEVMGLTDKNWQPPNIVLTTKTKSGKARTVPLISELHPLMTLPFQLTMWELRKAFEQARTQGLLCIGMTGEAGGILNDCSDYIIRVPSNDTPRIQECHITIGHIICELVEKNIFS